MSSKPLAGANQRPVDDEARIVDVVPHWPTRRRTSPDIRSEQAMRNKPPMPPWPKNTVVQMQTLTNERTGFVVKQQVFRTAANRRGVAQSPQPLAVEHVAAGALTLPSSARMARLDQLH
jgi:hypothetical protein